METMQYQDLLIEIADHQIETIELLGSIHLLLYCLVMVSIIIFLWLFSSKIWVSRGRNI